VLLQGKTIGHAGDVVGDDARGAGFAFFGPGDAGAGDAATGDTGAADAAGEEA